MIYNFIEFQDHSYLYLLYSLNKYIVNTSISHSLENKEGAKNMAKYYKSTTHLYYIYI